MIFIRRRKCFEASLLFVFIVSAIYLIYEVLNPNSDETTDYLEDFKEHLLTKSTTDRDFIDPNLHGFKADHDSDSEEAIQTTKAPMLGRRKYLNIYHGKHDLNETNCVPFKTLSGNTPICVYPYSEDTMISSYIKDYGTWEQDLLNTTAEIILSNPRLLFIDLGCNIGPFTIFVAKLGRKVFALDALKYNLDLLYKSLILGNVHQNVTLILNALSDRNQDVIVKVVRGNIGGSYIKDIEQKKLGNSDSQTLPDTVVEAIKLDNLLEIVSRGKEVFIKMDIEGNELKALKQASKFFQSVNVRYLLMEWMLHRTSMNGRDIMKFLLRNGMLPYSVQNRNEILSKDYGEWPDNVLWIKR